MSDMRWLERRGLTWFAVKAVPRSLWERAGKRRFIQSLKTHDLRIAVARRHAALAGFEAALAACRSTSGVDPIVEAGLAWRETFAALEREDPKTISRYRAANGEAEDPAFGGPTANPAVIAQEIALASFHDQLEDLTHMKGRVGDANLLASVAQGRATPLPHYVDAWIAEGGARGPVKVRTAIQYRRDVATLGTWLRSENVPATIEAVTKSVAGRYAGHFLAAGVNRQTANRKISAVSAYWRWLVKRTAAESNPWQGQSFSKARKPGEIKPKRPATAAEMLLLLNGDAGPELGELIRISALSGLRIEEIYLLRINDCCGGWFDIRKAKTAAGIRRVPIHPDLSDIIARRSVRKDSDAFLMHEAGGLPAPGRERSMEASKRFGRYRKRVGVHEALAGTRQSRVDFHSIRRWFITEIREAGVDQATVAALVGHDTGNITDDVYSGGPSDARLVAAVAEVRLPVAL